MFSAIRKRMPFSPATMIATLALVFAMSGGAFAAGHYLITSAKQIKPGVLAQLKGKAGANGASGAAGPAGQPGPQGAAGPQGPKGEAGPKGETGLKGENGKDGATGFTQTLPAGKTEMGMWSLTNPPENPTVKSSVPVTTISFVIPLESVPVAHFVKVNGSATAECPGSAEEPKAAEGQLCVYAQAELNPPATITPNAHTFGAQLGGELGAAPGGIAYGSWAVTAE